VSVSHTNRLKARPTNAVISGLDPASHLLETILLFQMDARVKAGHDEERR